MTLQFFLPDEDVEAGERGVRQYHLVTGSIRTAGFWRLRDKLDCTLSEIHMEGKVPQYAERLRDPLDRFFTKMEPGSSRVAERNNFVFQLLWRPDRLDKIHALHDGTFIPDELGLDARKRERSVSRPVTSETPEWVDPTKLTWAASSNGPESLFDAKTRGPAEGAMSDASLFELYRPIDRVEDLMMRTERQTLRKLPVSGAVVFTFHVHLVPLHIMVQEPGVPARLAHAIRQWPDDVVLYKGANFYSHLLLPYLDAKATEQKEAGHVESQADEEKKSRARHPLCPL